MDSSDIHLLFSVGQLAKRYGLRPSEAVAEISTGSEGVGKSYWQLIIEDGSSNANADRYEDLIKALGCDEHGALKVSSFQQLEDTVDQALSLAPVQFAAAVSRAR